MGEEEPWSSAHDVQDLRNGGEQEWYQCECMESIAVELKLLTFS